MLETFGITKPSFKSKEPRSSSSMSTTFGLWTMDKKTPPNESKTAPLPRLSACSTEQACADRSGPQRKESKIEGARRVYHSPSLPYYYEITRQNAQTVKHQVKASRQGTSSRKISAAAPTVTAPAPATLGTGRGSRWDAAAKRQLFLET